MQDPVSLKKIQSIKGTLFVLVTSALIFYLVYRELKKQELAIKLKQESENRFKSIVKNSNIGIVLANAKGHIIDVNHEMVKILGYSKNELIKMNFSEYTHLDDLDEELKLIEKINKNQIDNYRIEKRCINKNGHIKWVDIAITCFRKDNNEVDLFVGMVMDVTKRKKYQEDLEDAKTFILSILDNMPIGISVMDDNYNYILYNKFLQRISAHSSDQVIGKNAFELFPYMEKMDIKDNIEKAMAGEYVVSEDIKDPQQPDLNRWFYYVHYPNKDAAGKIIGVINQVIEITERRNFMQKTIEQNQQYEALNEELRQTNEELLKAKEAAEKSNHLKTVFLNNLSHEIRTPMNGIIGFSELLNNPDTTSEKRKYYVEIIVNSSRQLLRIIDDILEISQLETKQIQLNRSEFSLNKLLSELFEIYNLESKEQKISLFLKKELSDTESNINTDKSKLLKVLSNLIDNALKYTCEGFVEFGYYKESNNIILFVRDTGIGISPENHDKIFHRFVQEDKKMSEKVGGLGIGLSIAKENAQLIGGDITLKSEKGKGSTFFVTIPHTPAEYNN